MNDISYEASLRANYEAVRERLGVPPRRAAILEIIRETGAEEFLAPFPVPNEIEKPSKRARDWLLVGQTPKLEIPPPLPENLPRQMVILIEVAREKGFTLAEMRSDRKNRKLAAARQKAMWRMKKETSLSFPRIGQLLGGRDHTTILHGVRSHEARMARGEA